MKEEPEEEDQSDMEKMDDSVSAAAGKVGAAVTDRTFYKLGTLVVQASCHTLHTVKSTLGVLAETPSWVESPSSPQPARGLDR